jgi:hypothetical protein
MHTVLVAVIGLGVLGLCLLVGHTLGGVTGMTRAALAFLPLWLLGAGINLLIGVRSAGYSVADELPVFLVVFAVPSLAAAALWWRLH